VSEDELRNMEARLKEVRAYIRSAQDRLAEICVDEAHGTIWVERLVTVGEWLTEVDVALDDVKQEVASTPAADCLLLAA